MSDERQRQIEEVFAQALELPPERRRSFVVEQCGDDAALRAEILALLTHASSVPTDFLAGSSATSAAHRATVGEAAAPAEPAFAGCPDRLGRYRLLRRIGAGGMGTVYEAEQDDPRRSVALKVIRGDYASPETLRRFAHESRILGRLQHAGIAQIFEAATAPTAEGDRPYFAMEFIRGVRLDEYARRARLDARQRLELVALVCDAVHYAHQRGVIHRDLKPANILVDEAGQPKVLDFGVARLTDADVQTTTLLTSAGELVGTMPYMSPEQFAGDPHALDTRSDVYALGVILYQLLAEALPYDLDGKTVADAAQIVRERDPTPLSAVSRAYRGDVETIAAKALEKEKSRRYESAAELAADIRRYLRDEPIVARPPSAFYHLRKFARRNRVLVVSATGVSLALVIGTGVSLWQAARARTAERDARAAQGLAERNERLARREADRSRAVNEFLQKMLESPNPEQQGGDRNVTVANILQQAVRELDEGSLAGQPEIEAAVRATIGNTYRALGDPAAAEPQLRRAIQTARALGADGCADLAYALNKLARVELDKPDYAAAEQHFREALAIRRDLHGAEHEEVAKLLNNLGSALQQAGRHEEAEPFLRDGLAMRRRVLGEAHVDIASSLNNLALTLESTGRVDEAEAAFRESLAMDRDLRGDRHPNVALTMGNLGQLLARRGKYAEAEALMQQALTIQREIYDESHPTISNGLRKLGYVLQLKGDLGAAELQHQQALELDRRFGRSRHTETGLAMTYLGWVQLRQGKLEEAVATHREAASIQREAVGPDHPVAISAQFSLGWALMKAGQHGEAEEVVGEVIGAARRTHHDELSLHLLCYGQILTKLERFEDAEPPLLEAHQMHQAAHGESHRATRDSAAALTALYKAWDRPESAAQWEQIAGRDP